MEYCAAPGGQAAVFAMPHYSDDPRFARHLDRAVEGLLQQTGDEWTLVIVDDASPRGEDVQRLRDLQRALPGRVHCLLQQQNRGPGVCRNLGVQWAADRGAGIVLFHDADDVSHPNRLRRVRQLLCDQPEVDFVYSTFGVVDEEDRPLAESSIPPLVRETLEAHRQNPVTGVDGWMRIAAETGYCAQTSTVAVRTALALAHPFPEARVSEDSHTWLRMSGGGAHMAFLPDVPSLYRIKRTGASTTRTRVGAGYFYQKVCVDRAGFEEATALALARQSVTVEQCAGIRTQFLRRLAQSMRREGQSELADMLKADAGDTPDPRNAAAVVTASPR